MICILLVKKNGNLCEYPLKKLREDYLYKACGYKTSDDFARHTIAEEKSTWTLKHKDGYIYFLDLYGKINGRNENKYEFPPPVDNCLFFGTCAIVAKRSFSRSLCDRENAEPIKLTSKLWQIFYEKLYGGFEDLMHTEIVDMTEEDELENIPKEMKTSDGYLKDGFVIEDEKIIKKKKTKNPKIPKPEKMPKVPKISKINKKKTARLLKTFLDENESELSEEEFLN